MSKLSSYLKHKIHFVDSGRQFHQLTHPKISKTMQKRQNVHEQCLIPVCCFIHRRDPLEKQHEVLDSQTK